MLVSESKGVKKPLKKSTNKQEEEAEVKTVDIEPVVAEKPQKKRVKKPAANFDEVFEGVGEDDDEDDAPLPNTEQRMEIRRKEEFVKRVLDDSEDEMAFSNAIKINFAKKKTKKEDEFLNAILNAERYNADTKTGLTLNQVAERKEKGLVNVAYDSNAKTYRSIFIENIVTFFNILCIIVAIALISVQSYTNLAFLVMMMTNTIIGIVQEIKAKRSIEKLSLVNSPAATVVREGENSTIPTNEVVLDDIIYLENGKQICSDSIVIKGEMEVNESLLTGESVPVRKKTGDSLYAGSFVSSGACYARVDKVGNANYIASLTAFAKKYKKAKSEILSSLKLIISVIGFLIVIITPLLFWRHYTMPQGIGNVFERAITLTSGAVIGMIPAGMFLLTTVALSASVLKLSGKNILVQDLYCIEMLARVDMLCLDKTGTLTDGTMVVKNVMELKNETGHSLQTIIGSLLTATGDNNHTALALAKHFGYNKELTPSNILPFSSQRKLSAVSFEDGNTYILGAPEFVMREMGPRMERIINQRAKEGYRVMLLAQSQGEIKGDKLPTTRKPLAIITIEDHVREDAPDTLKWFKDNGVNVKVISGDNPVTVSEVAKRVGVDHAELYISLEGKTDPEVVELASQYTVFGRVTPEQKRILIRAFKAKGHTVAMTGDGVNDILALKEADCSIAIAAGSEAARNVSHMVLQDSNFAHMPSVVHEGRRVVNNIQKSSSLYLMKTLFSIVVAIMVVFLNTNYPFQPKQLLPLEMFVIGVPSFFLAFEANKNKIEGRFLTNIIKKAFPAGFTLILSFIALYLYNASYPNELLGADGTDLMTTVAGIILVFCGIMMLIRLCMPLNFFRTFLCCFSFLMAAVVLAFFPDFLELYLDDLNLHQALLIIIFVQSSYFVVSILTAFFNKLRINDGVEAT